MEVKRKVAGGEVIKQGDEETLQELVSSVRTSDFSLSM
jgi:hypothetical protein